MLRGYRGIIAALIGLTLIGAAPRPGVEPKRNQPATEQPRQPNLDRIATALERLPQSAAPDPGCKPGQDNRESDLCAQWKAADAASEAAFWTMLAFFAGCAGLGIGVFTLVFAAQAAHWAKKAAQETERSAKTSNKTFQAFVAVEDASLIFDASSILAVDGSVKYFSFVPIITNVGRVGCFVRTLKFGDRFIVVEQMANVGEPLNLERLRVDATSDAQWYKAEITFSSALSESVTAFAIHLRYAGYASIHGVRYHTERQDKSEE